VEHKVAYATNLIKDLAVEEAARSAEKIAKGAAQGAYSAILGTEAAPVDHVAEIRKGNDPFKLAKFLPDAGRDSGPLIVEKLRSVTTKELKEFYVAKPSPLTLSQVKKPLIK
jgi:hypothetical protein